MRRWDEPFEDECHRLVDRLCDGRVADDARNTAWRSLLVLVAPHIEAWAAQSAVLRRCGLGSEDEVRSVLVGVMTRMSARSFANLHAYLDQQPAPADDDVEATIVEGIVRLARLDELDAQATPPQASEADGTPLRGWLRSLTRYAVKDHVKQRFGWTTSVRVGYGLERRRGASARATLEQSVLAVRGVITAELDERTLVIEIAYLPGTARPQAIDAAIEGAGYRITAPPDLRRSKRDLVTGAERLDAVPEPGARPAITDAITLSRLLTDVAAFMTTFPAPMREAVQMWLDDEPFERIADALNLEGAERGRALVRAGLARLRERFREEWPSCER